MALQFRRGTEAERTQSGFVPLPGEPIYVTDTKRLYVGDGSTVGGNPVGYNNSLTDLQDVELISETNIPISSVSITSGTVNIITTLPHGLETGTSVYVDSSAFPLINGVHSINVTGITSLSFSASVADASVTPDTGGIKYDPADGAILAYSQSTGRWGEQSYVYKLEDLGDVEIASPQAGNIIQYTDIPIGDITDAESQLVESGVEEPSELANGLTWTQTGVTSRFINKPFEIGVSNLSDVLINESTLKNNQIISYDTTLELWTNKDYVDELTDLADVTLTPLPDLSEVQARVTLSGSWAENDTLNVQIIGTVYSYILTATDLENGYANSATNEELDNYLREIIGEDIVGQINADISAPVTASYQNNVITLNPKDQLVNLNLLVTVVDADPADGFTPQANYFEPVNQQILSYDGSKWTNKALEINNFNLADLSDVDLDNVTDGQILQYSDISGTWRNVNNFVTLTQFADVQINDPQQGEALIYNDATEKFEVRSFILDDLIDVNDPSFDSVVPDGSVLAYSEADQAWKPQQFTSLASRTEVSFNTGPLENLNITTVDFEAFTGYALFKIKASAPCTVTFYVSDYERLEDLDRLENEEALSGRGIFAELSPLDTSWRRIAPVIYGFNDDSPINRTAYVKVRNRSGYYQSNIEIRLVLLQIEEDPEQAGAG